MLRTLLTTIAGLLVGVAIAAALVPLTWTVLAWTTEPLFRIEGPVIYQVVVLGAGFGSLCGAIIGLAGVIARLPHDRLSAGATEVTPPSPSSSPRSRS
jgi:hypothetical protein